MDTPNTIWMTGYLPNGFKVSLTLDEHATAATVQTLLSKVALAEAAGVQPNLPGLEPGEETEEITAVMRRAKPSDGTPIIDFYPQWQGAFGRFKYASMYLDTPEEIAEFEAQSGLKLADIPVYDGQQALQRTAGQTHAKEIAVKRSFKIAKKETHIADDGKPRYDYRYFAPATPSPSPATPPRSGGSAKTTRFPDGAKQDGGNGNGGGSQGEAETAGVETINWNVFWGKVRNEFGLSNDEAHKVAGVDSMKDYPGTEAELLAKLKAYADRPKAS